MENFNYSIMPSMNLPCQQCSMMAPQHLETMYPKTYHIIMPAVENTCEKMHTAYGPMFTPTQEQLETMIDGIYEDVEPEVFEAARESASKDERQFVGRSRRLLRDLIGVILIGSLLNRVPFYGYPNYYYPNYIYPGYFNPIY